MIYYQRLDPDGRAPSYVDITNALILLAGAFVFIGSVVGWGIGHTAGTAEAAGLTDLLDRCATVSERSHAAVWGADWAILDTLDMLGLPDPADGLPVADDGSGG